MMEVVKALIPVSKCAILRVMDFSRFHSVSRLALLAVALLLVCSFVLHAVHFDHEHPGLFGTGEQAALHGDDKKRLMLTVAFVLILSFIVPALAIESMPYCVPLLRLTKWSFIRIRLSDPLRIAFRKGRIHPKIPSINELPLLMYS